MQFSELSAAVILIGDEILSGSVSDLNLNYLAKTLRSIGIPIKEVAIIPDHKDKIIETVRRFSPLYNYVFTTGGIGGTHDDITAESIAEAFQLPLIEDSRITKKLEELPRPLNNVLKKRFSLVPKGAELIENTLSLIPSFQIKNVFALAGMPSIMRNMMDGLLPTLKKGLPFYTYQVKTNLTEEVIFEDLRNINEKDQAISLGSYPFYETSEACGVKLVVEGRIENNVIEIKHLIREMIKNHKGQILEESFTNSFTSV